MPARLTILRAVRSLNPTWPSFLGSAKPATSLLSILSTQTRNASILASLSDNPGAYQKRIRLGRGPSSGKGKTSGRGQKGRKARGNINPWFQGGQTPLIVNHGRMGFDNLGALDMAVVNLDSIQQWIDTGRLDPSKPITPRELIRSGAAGWRPRDGIKLLARGKEALKTPVHIVVSRASAAAIEAIEAAGGRVVTRFYTKASIKRLVHGTSVHSEEPLPVGAGHVDAVLERHRRASGHVYRLPDPTSRWDMEYYRDPAHRGYLSGQLKVGESPSLYFKVPAPKKVVYTSSRAKDRAEEEADKLF